MRSVIDLTKKKPFGFLKVVRLKLNRNGKPKRNKEGRILWECLCKRCGNTTVKTGHALRGGHTKSCGCLRGAFGHHLPTAKAQRKRQKDKRQLPDENGKLWLALWYVAEILHVTVQTVINWREKCPWLDGRGIETWNFINGLGQDVPYYAKRDIQDVKLEQKRAAIPKVAGHRYLIAAAKVLEIHPRTLSKLLRQIGDKVKKVDCKGHDGTPRKRSYITDSAFKEIADRLKSNPSTGTTTCSEAATELGIPHYTVKKWCRQRLLETNGIERHRATHLMGYRPTKKSVAFAKRVLAELRRRGLSQRHNVSEARKLLEANRDKRDRQAREASAPVPDLHARIVDAIDENGRRIGALVETNIIVTKGVGAKVEATVKEEAQRGREALERIKATEAENADGYSFVLINKTWQISFGQERGKAKDSKAINQLLKALVRPNRFLTVAEMLGDSERKIEADAAARVESRGDDQAMIEIVNRIRDIDELAEQTGGGSESLENERASLVKILEESNRQFGSQPRTAFNTIATGIRRFRDAIRKEMPLFASHINDCLKMEFPHFRYEPKPIISWEI